MFSAKTYIQRRTLLKKTLKSGLVVLLGNEESPMNYPANTYPFRQDSSFLYFFGLDSPGLAAVIDVQAGTDTLYGDDITLEDVIWMGELPKLKDRAAEAGVFMTEPRSKLEGVIADARKQGRPVHYLPPYRPETLARLSALLGTLPRETKQNASEELVRAVVAQRSVKSEEEIGEMEKAQAVTRKMYAAALTTIRPGLLESDIVGAVEGISLAHGLQTAFPTILSVNVHVFHNPHHDNKLQKGRLLVMDAGASSSLGYASDITRTFPVSGVFTPKQRNIYEIVLIGQMEAIASMKPGVRYKDIHLATARTMAGGLKDLGLMKGDIEEAVAAGAHALFFPHGLGHMIGFDVHDMEGLGEDFVGYDDTVSRSTQFGLAYLRMARELRPGFVLTVEPGIYFIPALIDYWRSEKRHTAFIDYAEVEEYRDFTGVRIEDDVLITHGGSRVLGRPIPKKVAHIERTMASAQRK